MARLGFQGCKWGLVQWISGLSNLWLAWGFWVGKEGSRVGISGLSNLSFVWEFWVVNVGLVLQIPRWSAQIAIMNNACVLALP